MKQLGNKSLSTVLAIIANILWWSEWIFAAGCIVMGIGAATIRKGFALQIPISYSDMTVLQVRSFRKDGPIGILNTTNGILSVHIDANWQNIVMLLLGYGLLFATIVTITYQLKNILKSFQKDQPFDRLNIKRVRNIALILIGYSLSQWLFVVIVNMILTASFNFWHLDLTYNFNISCLIMGVVLLAVEGAFKAGLSLEEDKQLTI